MRSKGDAKGHFLSKFNNSNRRRLMNINRTMDVLCAKSGQALKV